MNTTVALIVSRQESRIIMHAASFGQMNALLSFVSENCCGGKP